MLPTPLFKQLQVFFLLLLLNTITGCNQPTKQTLTLTMSLGEEEWQVFRQDIFPLFEKTYGVKINAYQIEAESLSTKLEALKKAGQANIDLFAQDNMNLAYLVNKSLVADLSDYVQKIPSGVMDNLIDAGRFNGKLFFMPFRPNVQIVYYNKQAFEKYNLSLPRRWDDLLEVAKTFYEKEGTGRILLKAYGGNPTATQLYEFVVQAGGDPYAFNDKGCIRAFQFLQELSPYLSPESKRAKWDTTNDILARQEAYLASNWPFGVVILIRNYGLDFIDTYQGWSGPNGEYHVIGGDVFGIPKQSQNKELALQFIFFMQSKEIQEILTAKLGWPSIRKDAYANVPPWQRPHFETIQKALAKGVFRRNVVWWPAYSKFVNQAFREIVLEDQDVKTTLDKYKILLEENKQNF